VAGVNKKAGNNWSVVVDGGLQVNTLAQEAGKLSRVSAADVKASSDELEDVSAVTKHVEGSIDFSQVRCKFVSF